MQLEATADLQLSQIDAKADTSSLSQGLYLDQEKTLTTAESAKTEVNKGTASVKEDLKQDGGHKNSGKLA